MNSRHWFGFFPKAVHSTKSAKSTHDSTHLKTVPGLPVFDVFLPSAAQQVITHHSRYGTTSQQAAVNTFKPFNPRRSVQQCSSIITTFSASFPITQTWQWTHTHTLLYVQVVVFPCEEYSRRMEAPGSFSRMDLAACDKLHVEGNLQGPLNFSIAFILLSCSRRDEMGSVSFSFYFLLLRLFTALWPPVCWINGQRCLTVADILLSLSFFLYIPPLLQRRIQVPGTWSEAGKKGRAFLPAAVAQRPVCILLFPTCWRHGSLWDI